MRFVFFAGLLMSMTLLSFSVRSESATSIFRVEQDSGVALPAEEVPPVDAAEEEPLEPIEAAIQSLSIEQRVAQLMMVTLGGLYEPNSDDRVFFSRHVPGCAVIPQMNRPADATKYMEKLRLIASGTGVPLMVGGNLSSLVGSDRKVRNIFVQIPSLLSIAAAGDGESTTRLAQLVAEHMRTMGFDLYLGPSLELSPTLTKARGTIHHLGSNPQFAGDAALTFLESMNAHGVMSMPMGFPGGGGNRLPKAAAVLLTPRAMLQDGPLLPYRQAIEAGVPFIHVGNTLVPTIDDENRPASVSQAVITDLLRGELAYDGIIVAGPMDAPELRQLYSPEEAALRALSYGADMVYWRSAGNHPARAVAHIVQAIENEEIEESVIETALRRVLTLKEGLHADVDKKEKSKKADSLERTKDFVEEVYAVERRAVTLVKNDNNVLPLRVGYSTPVKVTGVVAVEVLHAILGEEFKQISMQNISTARHAGQILDVEIDRIIRHSRGIRTVVCVFTDKMRNQGHLRLVHALKEGGMRVVVVLLGYPSEVTLLSEADAIVTAYCDSEHYDITLRAVSDVLLGVGPLDIVGFDGELQAKAGVARTYDTAEVVRTPTGRLPLYLSERYPAGLRIPYDPGRAIKKVVWDFGNGKQIKEQQTEFTYREAGVYTTTLTVTDTHNESTSTQYKVRVSE
jgi:beta-N-acetylhexosaminidase